MRPRKVAGDIRAAFLYLWTLGCVVFFKIKNHRNVLNVKKTLYICTRQRGSSSVGRA